jgi:hypothetical protein
MTQHLPTPDEHDPSRMGETQRSKRRAEYLTMCSVQVFTALECMDAPATANAILAFLNAANERVMHSTMVLDDVRCGLLSLRKQKALIVNANGTDTFYALAAHVARPR